MAEEHSNTVLLVDDDPDVRQALRMIFEWEEFHLIGEASDGLEALRLAAAHQPAFVILDYHMPRLDGHKAAKILREVAPGTKIVAFSAVLESKPRWADAYLNKDRMSSAASLLSDMSSLS